MKQTLFIAALIIISGMWLFLQQSEATTDKKMEQSGFDAMLQGNNQQIKMGEHLVMIGGCHDCHTPKKMTEKGPEIDFSLALSGHPAKMPPPDVNRKEMEQKGLVVTQTLTSWIGPWGISYAANITSDATGIGNWSEKQFFTAIREGKYKGSPSGRMLLPPMPWDMYRHMTDDELRAVFAYLKSTKPIKNVVPAPQPPVSAGPGK